MNNPVWASESETTERLGDSVGVSGPPWDLPFWISYNSVWFWSPVSLDLKAVYFLESEFDPFYG